MSSTAWARAFLGVDPGLPVRIVEEGKHLALGVFTAPEVHPQASLFLLVLAHQRLLLGHPIVPGAAGAEVLLQHRAELCAVSGLQLGQEGAAQQRLVEGGGIQQRNAAALLLLRLLIEFVRAVQTAPNVGQRIGIGYGIHHGLIGFQAGDDFFCIGCAGNLIGQRLQLPLHRVIVCGLVFQLGKAIGFQF